jgi:hypothetical protein
LGHNQASTNIRNKNNSLHSIWSQCIKTRIQQQKQQQKMCKQFVAQQHIAQWSVGHWWNKRRN